MTKFIRASQRFRSDRVSRLATTRIGLCLTMAVATIFLCAFGATASAQDAEVVERLIQYGRMDRGQARETTNKVSQALSANAARGGDQYDAFRQRVNRAIYGEAAGPGATREEYTQRLGEVLARLAIGLDGSLLEAFFVRPSDTPASSAAMMCSHNFGVTMGECDSLAAAASRNRLELPFAEPSDGAELIRALGAQRVGRTDAQRIVRALRTTMLGLPRNLTQDDRGRALLRVVEACPGGIADRGDQLRAWHLGPTTGMAQCIARTLGPSGAPEAERLFGMNVRSASAFVAWGMAQDRGRNEAPAVASASGLPAQPQLSARWRDEARRHFQARRYPQAAAAYEAASTLDPNDSANYAGLGASRLAMGDAPSAVVAYEQAVRLAPRDSRFHSALGRALAAQGNSDGAIRVLQRAHQLDPNNEDAVEGLRALGGRPAPAGATVQPVVRPQAPAPAVVDVPSRDAIITAMRPLQEAVQGCAPSASGVVAFRVTVAGSTGQVTEVSLVRGDASEARACMEGVVRSAAFPRFERDDFSFDYPYELSGE